jgi:excisionase family DNA binding protein
METSQSERRTLTIPEVAERLGVARSTAYALAKRDALPVPVIQVGRRRLVASEPLERLLAGELTTSPAPVSVDDA